MTPILIGFGLVLVVLVIKRLTWRHDYPKPLTHIPSSEAIVGREPRYTRLGVGPFC